MYYFIRVNGQTIHDNPLNKDCFVSEEPKEFKRSGYSNYLSYCLEHNFVRFGWPDVGDLRTRDRIGAKSNCYDWNNTEIIKPYIRKYLTKFCQIQMGSIVLVPDRDNSGEIYIGQVIETYWYETEGPYECAHRVGVRWDSDQNNQPVFYMNDSLGISKGGWWRKAFYEINNSHVTHKINLARREQIAYR